ncbi:hypothetical protein KSP39_PZI007124 [Platanthera zijinensis]|uniref:Retrovirus-related Pol polyprotein from transposon TNT 1-94 n=1 Tax=Platanthera zijinensis TaxID=2320716 RepID=A0AAP0BRL8_9ASPA
MYRCEVMNALCSLNLEDVLDGDESSDTMNEKSYVGDVCGKSLEEARNKYHMKNVKNRLHIKRRLYRFQMRCGVSIDEHLNEFTELLTDLLNLDEYVNDEDKTLLLLNSLPDEYENFTMSLIHGKEGLQYSEVSIILLNQEFRRKYKESSKAKSAKTFVSHRGRSNEKKN